MNNWFIGDVACTGLAILAGLSLAGSKILEPAADSEATPDRLVRRVNAGDWSID